MRSIILICSLTLLPLCDVRATPLEDLLIERGVINRHSDPDPSMAQENAMKVYWKDGARIETPDNRFSLLLTSQIKTSYIYTDAPPAKENTSSFDVRNARMILSGDALQKEFTYKFEYDLKTQQALDNYLGWNTSDWLDLRMGQFKTPISRQFVNGSFKLMFPDVSTSSAYFSYGYQSGARAAAKFFENKLIAALSATNGNSTGEGVNTQATDTKNMFTSDVRWNPIGKMNAYEESDLDFTEQPALSFGTAYAYSPQNTVNQQVTSDLDVNRISTDANLKYRGLGINAEFYLSHESPSGGESFTTTGAYIQSGYFIVPKRVEIAGRWAMINCADGQGSGACKNVNLINQATADVTYYFSKYNLRVQAAYDYLHTQMVTDDTNDQRRWIMQVVGIL